MRQLLQDGAKAGGLNRDGSTPLSVAALLGRAKAAGLLIQAGAEVDPRVADGSTPLHTAAFFGRAETVELLLEAGADITATNNYGQTPLEVTAVDWKTTEFIAAMVQVKVDREEVEAGRAKAAELLRQQAIEGDPDAALKENDSQGIGGLTKRLMISPFFHHLWFLWFLCWLVVGFGVYAFFAERLGWNGLPDGLILSPVRFLWLIPLTMVPQWFMGRLVPVFGPDTSAGLLPMPHVLIYYAIFFGFGALYFDSDDDAGRVGRGWWISLPVGLIVVFPLGLGLSSGVGHLVSSLLQVAYAWTMIFGLMGLFRRLLANESRTIRYLSDSSYWLYLAHLPLIIGAQIWVRDWPLPAIVKFLVVCGATTGILLIAYQILVRYTWLGRLLNGPRERPRRMRFVGA
jgi:hypothetical protein